MDSIEDSPTFNFSVNFYGLVFDSGIIQIEGSITIHGIIMKSLGMLSLGTWQDMKNNRAGSGLHFDWVNNNKYDRFITR